MKRRHAKASLFALSEILSDVADIINKTISIIAWEEDLENVF